jgi:hypothetical protein
MTETMNVADFEQLVVELVQGDLDEEKIAATSPDDWARPMSRPEAKGASALAYVVAAEKIDQIPLSVLLLIPRDAWRMTTDKDDFQSTPVVQVILQDKIDKVPEQVLNAVTMAEWIGAWDKRGTCLVRKVAAAGKLALVLVADRFVNRADDIDALVNALTQEQRAQNAGLIESVKAEVALHVVNNAPKKLSLNALFGGPKKAEPVSPPPSSTEPTVSAGVQAALRELENKLRQANKENAALKQKEATLKTSYVQASKDLQEYHERVDHLEKTTDEQQKELERLRAQDKDYQVLKGKDKKAARVTPTLAIACFLLAGLSLTGFLSNAKQPQPPLFPEKEPVRVDGQTLRFPVFNKETTATVGAMVADAGLFLLPDGKADNDAVKQAAGALKEAGVDVDVSSDKTEKTYLMTKNAPTTAFSIVGFTVQGMASAGEPHGGFVDGRIILTAYYNKQDTSNLPIADLVTLKRSQTGDPRLGAVSVTLPMTASAVSMLENKRAIVLALALANQNIQTLRPEAKFEVALSKDFVASRDVIASLSRLLPHAGLVLKKQALESEGKTAPAKLLTPSIEAAAKGLGAPVIENDHKYLYLLADKMPAEAGGPVAARIETTQIAGQTLLHVTLCVAKAGTSEAKAVNKGDVLKAYEGGKNALFDLIRGDVVMKSLDNDADNAMAIAYALEKTAAYAMPLRKAQPARAAQPMTPPANAF